LQVGCPTTRAREVLALQYLLHVDSSGSLPRALTSQLCVGYFRLKCSTCSYNKSDVLSRGWIPNQASRFASEALFGWIFLSIAWNDTNEWTSIIAAAQHEAFRCWLHLQNQDIWRLLVHIYSSLLAQLTSLRTRDQESSCNKFEYELWIQDLQ